MSDKKYINGLYITEFDGKYGDYLSFGITDEGIEELKRLPKNEKGVRNFTAFRRKNDNKKFNPMWPREGNYAPSKEQDAPPPTTEKDLSF